MSSCVNNGNQKPKIRGYLFLRDDIRSRSESFIAESCKKENTYEGRAIDKYGGHTLQGT